VRKKEKRRKSSPAMKRLRGIEPGLQGRAGPGSSAKRRGKGKGFLLSQEGIRAITEGNAKKRAEAFFKGKKKSA